MIPTEFDPHAIPSFEPDWIRNSVDQLSSLEELDLTWNLAMRDVDLVELEYK